MPNRDALLHITDLHFWEIVWNPLRLLGKRFLGNLNVALRRNQEFHTERAETTADALAATGISTVFAGGDFTSTSTDREFEMAAAFLRTLAGRGLRVLAIPGNHDRYTFTSARRRRFERYLGEFLPAELPCRVDLPGGTPFLLLPGAQPNVLSSCGRIHGRDIERTAELLSACPPGPVLVGAHYPLLPEAPGYETPPLRRLRNAEALRQALGGSGRTILHIAGHVHRASYVQDPQYPGLWHATTDALFFERSGAKRRGMFTEIQVSEDRFDLCRHVFDGAWRRTGA